MIAHMLPRSLVLLLIAVSAMLGSGCYAQKGEIATTDYGISLYGKFRFESEGDLFSIHKHEGEELVPPGAVLSCIRAYYAIGYFAGGATVTEDNLTREISKVFFIMKPNGEFTYYEPTPDGNFPGDQLRSRPRFGKLYDPER